MQRFVTTLLAALVLAVSPLCSFGQEVFARVSVNHKKVQGTDDAVFDNLREALEQFINEFQWTNLQFKKNERINCSFNITVNKYDANDHRFECSLLFQATRPVFGSSYTTVTFSTSDANFNFRYQEYDKIEFRLDQIDNDLTALVAFYVYMAIGIDMDSMASLGGTEVLQTAQQIVTNAQSLPLSQKGWKAFDDTKNRFALVNDYLDGALEPLRKLIYQYHRAGLDVMAENSDRGRAAVTEALMLLKQAHADKPLSMWPQIFTEYKRDEIVNIYKGKANATEKSELVELLTNINASMTSYWRQIE